MDIIDEKSSVVNIYYKAVKRKASCVLGVGIVRKNIKVQILIPMRKF